MSSDSRATAESAPLRDRVLGEVEDALSTGARRQATVETVDRETGTVVLSFGCGCSGGLAPPEKAVLRTSLVENLPSVTGVQFGSGCGCGSGHGGRGGQPDRSTDGPEAPF